jgi:hypothetical protein
MPELARHRRYRRASSEIRLDCCAVDTPDSERGVARQASPQIVCDPLRGFREGLMESAYVAARQKTFGRYGPREWITGIACSRARGENGHATAAAPTMRRKSEMAQNAKTSQ